MGLGTLAKCVCLFKHCLQHHQSLKWYVNSVSVQYIDHGWKVKPPVTGSLSFFFTKTLSLLAYFEKFLRFFQAMQTLDNCNLCCILRTSVFIFTSLYLASKFFWTASKMLPVRWVLGKNSFLSLVRFSPFQLIIFCDKIYAALFTFQYSNSTIFQGFPTP